MFGYIMINKPELKIKDYEIYHSYYCGLCRKLREDYGIRGQMALTYDMTFLILLLTGIYEPETTEGACRCLPHPLKKHPTRSNVFTGYAAAMNVILAYYQCEDDWRDEKKKGKAFYARLLKSRTEAMCGEAAKKREKIGGILNEIRRCEEQGVTDIDRMAGLTGGMLSEVFACKKDEWEEELRKIGFYLGKFIYLCDAYEDVEQDIKSGSYNLLKDIYREEGFDNRCKEMLTMMMAECCREFEKLPVLENLEILRNILYSGVWCRYEQAKEKRHEGDYERSI